MTNSGDTSGLHTHEDLRRLADIARFVGIDRTATSRALRHMEAAGLVDKRTIDGVWHYYPADA